MATQATNILEEDRVEQAKRELTGAAMTASEAIKEAAVAATAPVTNTVQEVFYDSPIAKAFAVGVFTGFGLVEISTLITKLVR